MNLISISEVDVNGRSVTHAIIDADRLMAIYPHPYPHLQRGPTTVIHLTNSRIEVPMTVDRVALVLRAVTQ